LTFEGANGKPTYDPEHCTFFPRMYSQDERHIQGYKSWSGHQGNRKPTMGENLSYFGGYQVDWMYWRYFMWNFSGRQWDEQGYGGARDGNWISGLNFIDKHHIGNQIADAEVEKYLVKDSSGSTLKSFTSEIEATTYLTTNLEGKGSVEKWDNVITPAFIRENESHNKFYMLPLILGLIGFIFMLMKASKEWWIVMLLFMLTGFAIIIYLNQKPTEPRERDYAYAASFYAFSIFIGLGVLALYQAYKTMIWKELAMLVAPLVGLGISFQRSRHNPIT
jgi:hypothetical protein